MNQTNTTLFFCSPCQLNQYPSTKRGFAGKFLKLNLLWVFCLLALVMTLLPADGRAQKKATWIWYPGDFEVWLGNKMQNRRTERGSFLPPFWRMDNHYVLVEFHREFDLSAPEEVELAVEGRYNVRLDGKAFQGDPSRIAIPAGHHALYLKVFCQDRVPAIFVKGSQVVSDTSWLVTFEDKEWIDATGKVSDKSGTSYLYAAGWNFDRAATPPSGFHLDTEPQRAVSTEKKSGAVLVDFGKETFGYVKLHGLEGKGSLTLYYGESREEALTTDSCETLDHFSIDRAGGDTVLNSSKAFRYVNIRSDGNVRFDSASMLYEFSPVVQRGKFRCSDEEINRIWDVATYTLHLNTREFFIDGIKRDRWVWSGDAYQSYLMNYYLYFNSPTVTRTLFQLRGKDPVTSHVNTIMDYTFYWFLGVYDYYLYTGDKAFIRQIYPRMQSLIDFCLARRNKNGLLEGLAGDWVFIDWADGLSKQGEVSFEQLLFCRSLETMALCAGLVEDTRNAGTYRDLAASLKQKVLSRYWDPGKQAFVHSIVDGVPTKNVTRYTNMFAIFFDYISEAQKQGIKKRVLLNDSIQKITTPYMRFYELEALCAMGEQPYVLKEMKSYWGGMLRLGATSFWEEYDPGKSGAAHYAMYGRPFGKSLCHAWCASPIYLLGKYYLGIRPDSPGYETYVVEPHLGGLAWMEGTVPAPWGDIDLYCSTTEMKIRSAGGMGTLRFRSRKKPTCREGNIESKGGDQYEMKVESGKSYQIRYNTL